MCRAERVSRDPDRNELSAERRYQALGSAAETGLERLRSCSARYSRPVRELRASGRQDDEHEPCPAAAKRGDKFAVYLGNLGILAHCKNTQTRGPGSRPAEANRGRERRLSLLEESRVRGIVVQYGAARSSVRLCFFTYRSAGIRHSGELHCWTQHSGRPQQQQLKDCNPWPGSTLESAPRHPREAYSIGRQTGILSGHIQAVAGLALIPDASPCFPSRH